MMNFYKKILAIILAFVLCSHCIPVATFASYNEDNVYVVFVELQRAKYYETVETEEQIRDSVTYVEFTATMSDGTEINYNSEDGWSNGATYQVSAYIQNETDEDFGALQSLYITIDGQDFWAGYTEVEVNRYKAIFRRIATLDGRSEEIKDGIYCWIDGVATSVLTFISKIWLIIYDTISSVVHLITG